MKYKKITLVFPGQGSQYIGMGKELYDQFPVVREIYDRANKVLGYDLADMCFHKPGFGKMIIHRGEDLNKTLYTQPAVLTTGYACYKVLEQACREATVTLTPAFLAGHSLGEYTALVVSGAMAFDAAVALVHSRASHMTELGKSFPGAGLMAVISRKTPIDFDRLVSVCKDFQIYITLKNTKNQVVVGGSTKQMTELAKELKNQGLASTVLKVEGPFHTPIMRPAAEQFKKELSQCNILIGAIPVIANVSTEAIVDPIHIRKELYEQIFNVVDWKGSVERMIAQGSDLFIEVGPKKVLSNMIRDIDPSIPQLNVEDRASLERTLNELQT